MIAEQLERHKPFLRQIARFLIVGGIGTTLAYLVFYTLVAYIHYAVASVVSTAAGITLNYMLNRAWTFNNGSHHGPQNLVGFYLLYTFSWLVSLGVLVILVNQLSIEPRVGGLMVIPISTAINFVGQKYLIFPDRQSSLVH